VVARQSRTESRAAIKTHHGWRRRRSRRAASAASAAGTSTSANAAAASASSSRDIAGSAAAGFGFGVARGDITPGPLSARPAAAGAATAGVSIFADSADPPSGAVHAPAARGCAHGFAAGSAGAPVRARGPAARRGARNVAHGCGFSG